MALLDSCYCCNLLIASVLVGVYVLVAYVIAFAIEVWWILEAEVPLPAPAYLLCGGYFCIFIQSAFLLHGLSVKRSFLLMGWLFVLVICSFPEAGLVLFMSLYHWELDHLYGLTELTCWVIRLIINMTGLVIVQSLYSQWKEEEEVMHRLQALNMSSIIPTRIPTHPGNGQLINGHLGNGYVNDGYIKSNNRQNGSLRRSQSAMSIGLMSEEAQLYGGPLPPPLPLNNNLLYDTSYPVPLLNNIHYPSPPMNNTYYPSPLPNNLLHTPSEFNASQFDALNNSYTQQIFNNLSPEAATDGGKFSRTQSMLDLRTVSLRIDKMADYNMAAGGTQKLGYVAPSYTQSLDRRAYRKKANSVCGGSNMGNYVGSSLERMNVYTDSDGRYVLQTGPSPRQFYRYRSFDKRAAGSGRSLAESDDMQRYRDIAL